jgi:hypothetical protein
MPVVHSASVPEAKRGGKLVRVPVPGKANVLIAMYEDDARARGLLPPAPPKKREPVPNKMRKPVSNKAE